MTMPRWLVKTVAVCPGVVVSTALVWMVGSVLPPTGGAVLFWAGLAVAAVAGGARTEPLAALTLMAARRPRPKEWGVLAPAVTMLCRVGLGPPVIQIRVRPSWRRVGARGAGRRTLVLSTGLVEAMADGVLPADQAAAVIADQAALVQGGWVRADLLLTWWSLPWDVLGAVVTAFTAAAGRALPPTRLAWRARVVVGAIAVVQQAQQGQRVFAALIAGILAVSYAVPVAGRAWQLRKDAAGDAALGEAGLDRAMLAYLRRLPSDPQTRRRIRALSAAVNTAPGSRGHLALVR